MCFGGNVNAYSGGNDAVDLFGGTKMKRTTESLVLAVTGARGPPVFKKRAAFASFLEVPAPLSRFQRFGRTCISAFSILQWPVDSLSVFPPPSGTLNLPVNRPAMVKTECRLAALPGGKLKDLRIRGRGDPFFIFCRNFTVDIQYIDSIIGKYLNIVN